MSSASSAERAASAASAAARACAVVTCRMSHLMNGKAGGATDSVESRDQGDHELEVGRRRRAQDRADLSAEHLRLVEAHSDCAPAEERIRFGRAAEGGREFVPTQIVRADHDRMTGKGFADAPEVLGLFVLTGKTAVARNQEFGPEQPHAFRSVRLSRFDLVGQIHVAAQRDVHAVERDGWLSNGFLETRSQLAAPCVGALGLLDLGRGWIELYCSARVIE